MDHLLVDAFVIAAINLLNYWFTSVLGTTHFAPARILLLAVAPETGFDLGNKIVPAKRSGRLNTAGLFDKLSRVLKLRCSFLTPDIVVRGTVTNFTWVMYFLSLFHRRHMVNLLHFLRQCHFLKLVWIYAHFIFMRNSLGLYCWWGLFCRYKHTRRGWQKWIMYNLVVHFEGFNSIIGLHLNYFTVIYDPTRFLRIDFI